MEVVNKEKILELPLGEVCGTMATVIENEEVDGGVMVIVFQDENGEGYKFDLSVEKLENEKSLKDKLKFW